MSGFKTFFVKELVEALKTWRGKLVLAIVLIFALTSPILAYIAPKLLGSIMGTSTELALHIPAATYKDSYTQWIKNIQQIGAIVILIASGGLIATEVQNGTAQMVLSKPLSRTSFVLSKFLAQAVLVSGAMVLGGVVCEITTRIIFGKGDLVLQAQLTGVMLLAVLILIAFTLVFSSRLSSLASAGLGILMLFLMGLGTLWKPLAKYTPIALQSIPTALMEHKTIEWAWPLATSAVLIIVCVALAAFLFSRREI